MNNKEWSYKINMYQNVLIQKSLKFSSKIIKLQKYLISQKRELIISKQILRSGTSIGANINEGNYASSRVDFIAKMHIALKECAETEYWIRLLKESDYITEEMFQQLISDCLEIKKILISTLNTSKKFLIKEKQ